MRKLAIELLAGTALTWGLTTPGIASPTVRSVAPPPATINGQMQRHVAPPPRTITAVPPRNESTRFDDNTKSNADVATPPPTPAPVQMPVASSGGIDLKGALDKLLAASDSQISDKLRGLLAGRQTEKLMPRTAERNAAEAFYKSHNYAPIWIKDGALTSRAKTAIIRLKNAAADGLDPADYPVPDFGASNGAEALAEGDITLTNSVLDYARHLEIGRIAPARVTTDVDYGNHTPDPATLLREITASGDVNATFESFNPPHAGFRALKEKLAALRSNASADVVPDDRIAEGPTLRPGMKDSRVPKLREKLRLRSRTPTDPTYDLQLARAIAALQKHARLQANGNLDNRTLAVINGPAPISTSKQIDTIIANMERWRWLPRDLGRNYVMVNIPDYTLKVVQNHDVVWRTKIVAGKPQTPTPLLTAAMDNIIVNPSWYVPQSIIQNELLPLYDSDPNIFERMGLEVRRGPDGNINVVQPPGAANSLGRIKFNFPNKFQVYLHDTPEKKLFAYDKRAFSHGCMRVEDPTKFGEIVLAMASTGPTPTSQQLYGLFGHDEKQFKLTNRPMVHLTYQTAYVDDAGKLVIRDDLYGFDSRIHTILNSDERRIADMAPPPDPKRDLATFKSNQEILRRVERREAQNPFVFFERLFR
jgi:murein L,D-transpeptidase YcbB/YkuD